MAPGTDATFDKLQSKRPTSQREELPPNVLNFVRQGSLILDRDIFAECLRTAPKGSSPGPGGLTYEHLRVLLDDPVAFGALADAAEALARADLPTEVSLALIMARMAALRKDEDGVRGSPQDLRCVAWLPGLWLASSAKT